MRTLKPSACIPKTLPPRQGAKEERTEMFPKSRETKVDLVKMRDALQSRKEELMGNLEPAAA